MFYTIYIFIKTNLFKKKVELNNIDTNFVKVDINDKYRCPV
jgi:hypothetical protein